MKKFVIYPALEEARLTRVIEAAEGMAVINVDTISDAVREIRDADGFFGKMLPEILAAAGKLRWIQTPTASLEHYLFPALIEHPCQLTNMRGLFSDVIADHVMGYVLCFARNLHTYLHQQSRGVWKVIGGDDYVSSFVTGPGTVSGPDRAHMHLADCSIGIVGLGCIGSEIARRAQAFGMRVSAVDPIQTIAPDGVELGGMDQLDRLLRESDFVVVAAPHTPETQGMFGASLFSKMRSSAYFINIGRGAIVSLTALVEALRLKHIAGAALDVFETEPLPAEHPLWQLDNVILTPHVAACSVRVPERHLQVLLDNVRHFARDEPLKNIVDKRRWF